MDLLVGGKRGVEGDGVEVREVKRMRGGENGVEAKRVDDGEGVEPREVKEAREGEIGVEVKKVGEGDVFEVSGGEIGVDEGAEFEVMEVKTVRGGEVKTVVEGHAFEVREVKRVRRVRGGGRGVDVKRVAEMVLVLEAIGKIRGGKSPSEVERELMAEAREKLIKVCQDFAPKDVFPRDVFGGVIEDLGLTRFKEQQRLGYKVPRMPIAEKLLLSKKKMEKAEEFAIPPPSTPQRLQGATTTTLENGSPSLPVRVTIQDKASQAHIPSATRQPAANFTPPPLLYQPRASEVRGTVSNFVPSSQPIKDSSLPMARVDRPPFRVDGRPNGSSHSHASQVQAQAQAHPTWNQTMVKTSGVPVQPQSFSSTQRGSDNRVSTHPAASKPPTTQVITGNLPTAQQGIHTKDFVKAPHTRNQHAEIANIVQKLLQKRLEHPLWTPPSRDYMNKALSCQMCQLTVTDVDSILICDNCEKGYHLKCFQTGNHKGALKGEWHCLRCLSANLGKPLPPKYGKVMRNQKSMGGPSPEKKGEMVEFKPNVQKVASNCKILIQKGPPGIARSLSSQQTPESKFQNALAMRSNEAYSNEGETKDIKSSTAYLIPSEQPADEKRLITAVPRPFSNSNIAHGTENHPQPFGDQSKDQLGLYRSSEFSSSEEPQSDPQKELKGDERGVIRVNPAEVATSTSMSAEPVNSSSGHSYDFNWVGDISDESDGKIYYQSCRVNGVIYKVHDHVHICFDNGKLTPSRLQAMWEDRITRTKRVTVNRCYFPSDLPESVGRPCGLESSEVYESSCSISLEAGLIRGPCDVLPPNKFEAEKERASSGMEGDYSSRPCYVCKWIYDESKGLFRDVSC